MTVHVCTGLANDAPDYPSPEGYIAWHEWAKRQSEKGHEQVQCCMCCKFRFPVELSGRVHVSKVLDSWGRTLRSVSPICRKCADR